MAEAAITTDVKSASFAQLFSASNDQTNNVTTEPELGASLISSGIPDLVTLENDKRTVEKVVHEQESFWSWFCFRLCCCGCCEGSGPRPPNYAYCVDCRGCEGSDCSCDSCGHCCEGLCCGCGGCAEVCVCNECPCPSDAEVCTVCCVCCLQS